MTTPTESASRATDFGPDTYHILVVDDDTRIRELLKRYLIESGFRVTTAKDALDARSQLTNFAFDLIVLDLMMPGEDGLALTESLRRRSDVPILMLTARGEPEDRIKGLEVGVDDYLPKPFEPRELLLRIETIIRRTKPALEEGTEFSLGECRFDPSRGELWRGDEAIKVTTAEVAILRLLASNPGRAFSRLELSEKSAAGSERSVDVQMTRLRRKIEKDPRTPIYLQTIRGVGYALVPD